MPIAMMRWACLSLLLWLVELRFEDRLSSVALLTLKMASAPTSETRAPRPRAIVYLLPAALCFLRNERPCPDSERMGGSARQTRLRSHLSLQRDRLLALLLVTLTAGRRKVEADTSRSCRSAGGRRTLVVSHLRPITGVGS
jgi:hypothetical protein